MRIKTIPKMLILLLLSLTTMMSITLSAFADYDGDGAGSTGSNIDNTRPGFAENDQGYRLALIDSETGRLIGDNVVDLVPAGYSLGSSNGIDICPPKRYGSVGTDPTSSSLYILQYPFPDGAPKPLLYTGSSFLGNGKAVREWMLQDSGNGKPNILNLAYKYFMVSPAIEEKLKSGEFKISLEGLYNIPIYNSSGAYVGYRATGTMRDIIMNELKPLGSLGGPRVDVIVCLALEALILEYDNMHLSAVTPSYVEFNIGNIVLNSDLRYLGVGMHIFNLSDMPEEEIGEPERGEETIYITESRITRRKNLNDSALSVSETLGAHEFKWDIDAFFRQINTINIINI